MAFDPDKYLAEAAQPAEAFDPDAYLAAAPSKPSADLAPRHFLTAREPEGKVAGALRRVRESLSPIIGPTENQRLRREQSQLELARDIPQLASAAMDSRPDLAQQEGFVPAMFTPSDRGPLLIPRLEGDGGGRAGAIGRGAVNALTGAVNSMTSSPGGLMTLGVGGLGVQAARAGTLTPAATRAIIGSEVAFAADQGRQLVENLPASFRAAREISEGGGDDEANSELLAGQAVNALTLGLAGGDARARSRRPNIDIQLDRPEPVRIDPQGSIEVEATPSRQPVALELPAPALDEAPPAPAAPVSLVEQYPEVYRSKPENDTPVLIRTAEGEVYPATINGYYDLGGGDVRASIGRPTAGGWSHGMLRPGEEFASPVPTPSQWEQGIRDVSVVDAPTPAPAELALEPSLAGRRNAAISDGSGTPTAYESQMIADWKNSIAQEQAGGSDVSPPPPPSQSALATLPGGEGSPALIPEGAIAQPPMPPTIPPGGTPPTSGGGGGIPLSIYQGPVDRVFGNLKKTLVDFAAPIEDTQRRFEKQYGYEMDPNSSIANYIDRVLNSQKMGGQFARDTGLFDVIQQVPDLEDFSQYLIDKHAIDVEANGVKSGRDIAAATQNVSAKQQQYAELEAKVRNVSDSLLQRSVQYGLISPDTAAYLNDLYPNYVPFDRVFDELERTQGGASTRPIASLGRQTAIRQFEGSERAIQNPLGSMLKKIEDVFTQGERNIAARTLAEYRNLPGWNDLIRELPEGRNSPHTFSYLDNGVRRTFEAPKEIAEAAKNLNYQTLGPVLNALAIPLRIARAGITGLSIPFTASNIVRDQITTFVQSRDTPEALLALPKAIWEAVGHGEVYDEMVRQGALSTSYDLSRNAPMETVDRIRSDRSVPSKVAYTVTHPSELLRQVEGLISRSEELSRLQNFIGAQQSALARGLSPQQAITEAARAARSTTANFSRRGEWGTVLNSLWLYLNAGIQSSRATYRAFRRNPIGTTAKVGLAVMTPITLATLWNTNDEERKAAYEDIPDYEKENNIIILPPNPVKDENGRWDGIKIPLPPGLGRLAGLARRPIEALRGMDPVAASDIAQALIGPFTPLEPETNTLISNMTPMAGRPVAEASLNKNFFTGANIVPERLARLPADMQYDNSTSRLAIAVGQSVGVSPMKIDHLLKGYFGEAGQNVLNYGEKAAALFDDEGVPERVGGRSVPEGLVRRFGSVAGGESARRFYEVSTTANQAREGYRQLALNGTQAEADAFYNANKALIDSAPLLNNIGRQLSVINRLSRTTSEKDAAENRRLNALRDTYVREGNRIMRELGAANK